MGSLEPNTPPAISMARLAMTSLAFMLVCVPLPVCQTRNGNCALSVPAITSSAACTMSRALAGGSLPSASFTSAAAFFRIPKAQISSGGMRSLPILKWSNERAVWAPQ